MTNGFGSRTFPGISDTVLGNQEAEACLIPMGSTSENVPNDFNISRQVQDVFAAKTFQETAAAQNAGEFKYKIFPIESTIIDPKAEKEVETLVDADDGIQDGVTAARLSKLKPFFIKEGKTHAGNASWVSDGAAAILLPRRSVARTLGLCIVGKFVNTV